MDPADFIKKLKRRPASLMKYGHFIDLYNSLMKNCELDAAHSAALSDAISSFLRKRGLLRHALLFDELSARAYLLNGQFAESCEAMVRLIEADQSKESRDVVLELARGTVANSHTFGASTDQRPEVLAALSTVFSKLGKLDELADVHLEAASVYSHHGAIQAAYRSVSDAEIIAHKIKSLPLLARTLGQAASVACFERDYEWSIGAAEKALAIYKELSTEPPAYLLSNLALAQLHTNKLDNALQTFRDVAAVIEDDPLTLAQVLVNLATCLRHKGEFAAAALELDAARFLMPSEAPFEAWIELELVSAKLSLERRDFESAISFLGAAAQRLDDGLVDVFRLHHRRGLREQYIERFEGIFRALPPRGSAASILPIIAAIRGNSLGDWLVLLEWADIAVIQGASAEEQSSIKDIIGRLRRFGAPHLFGYHEKYDDAWQPMNHGSAWDDLSKVAHRLVNRGVQGPFSGATLFQTVARIKGRLSSRHALATLTYAGEGAMLWILFGEQYVRVQLPSASLSKWKQAQTKFSVDELNRTAYAQELQILLDVFRPLLQSAFSELAAFSPLSVLFICDFDNSLPFIPLVLENEELANEISASRCEIRIVPALVLSQEDYEFVPQRIVAIEESSDDLLLPKHEGEVIASTAGMKLERVATAKQDKSLKEIIGTAEALIVSTHGQPLGIFTDAIFAGMNNGHVINVATLQEEASELSLRLVILNACHSGTASGRNFQKSFRTSDAVTFPSLFLLNRQAVVSASLWRVSDTVSYIYAALIGASLERGVRPALAISSSIATIRRLTKSQAIALLEKISDPETRQSAIQRLASAPEVGLFSNPYIYGALALFGLL